MSKERIMSALCRISSRLRWTTASQYEFRRFFRTDVRLRREKQGSLSEKLQEILVCPLSKKPLRYDAATNELINDELGVAYPIVNGIPNLVPTDGRIITREKETSAAEEPDNKS